MTQNFAFLLIFFSLFGCSTNKKATKDSQDKALENSVKRFINCHNTRDLECLNRLYDREYQSLSPVHKPFSISSFIETNLENLAENNFEVIAQIKEIQAGNIQAFVYLDWQLKTKGDPKENDPFANVQRVDIWKRAPNKPWKLYRTIIYNEKAF